jgi:hypothetical protein
MTNGKRSQEGGDWRQEAGVGRLGSLTESLSRRSPLSRSASGSGNRVR